MKKKRLLLLGLAAAAAVGVGGFFAAFAVVDGAVFLRSADCYDLSGHDLTPSEYETLRNRFPEKQILWSVPFQGQRLSTDTRQLKLNCLTMEEVDLLELLPNLEMVDAAGCKDYEALMALARRRPECRVSYEVEVGGNRVPGDAQELTVDNASGQALRQALSALPDVKTVTLNGELPDTGELLALKEDFPHTQWNMNICLGGIAYPSDVQSLWPEAGTDFEELCRVLPLFTELRSLDLTALSLDISQCSQLINAFPELDVRCILELGGRQYASNETVIDLSGVKLSREELRQGLTVLRRLKKVVVDGCGLDDETLDELNLEFPDTDVVWTLDIGGRKVATDAIFFYPAKGDGNNMPSQKELRKLRFYHNMIAVDIGHADTDNCEWAAGMPHLKYLILADTQIADISPLAGLKELLYLELFRLPITDYSPLLGCTALQDLNLGMTCGDPEPLSRMTWLHNLHWNRGTENPATADAVRKLPEQLSDTNVIFPDSSRNIGGTWRFLPNYYVFRDIIGGDFLNQEHAASCWGEDAFAIRACGGGSKRFVGDVLAQVVKRRMDAGEPIPGVKNVNSDKARILYETMLTSRP